ncbi:MAG: hypothetical protein ACFFF4_00930 [Candidatus Thorarchaeota archaeon]
MTQKWLYAGIILIFVGFILNEVTLLIWNLSDPIIPGVQVHSRPPIAGSVFLFLIPLGAIFVVRHFVLKSKLDKDITSPFQDNC